MGGRRWSASQTLVVCCLVGSTLIHAAAGRPDSERSECVGPVAEEKALTLSRTDGNVTQCLVAEDSAWPRLGNCTDQNVLQLYVTGSRLHTRRENCLMALGMLTGPQDNITRPYLVNCIYANETEGGYADFELPLKNSRLKVAGADLCLSLLFPPPNAHFGPDTEFVECAANSSAQAWHLRPVDDTPRVPGTVGDIALKSKKKGPTVRFHMYWPSGLPDNVDANATFKVNICLESFPAKSNPVQQCVTWTNWSKSSFWFSLPAETAFCRRHFEVRYMNENGWGQRAVAFLGCVGRHCPDVCFETGSQPATVFPK